MRASKRRRPARRGKNAAAFRHFPVPWGTRPRPSRSLLFELPVFTAAVAVFYSLIAIARYWSSPLTPQVDIDLGVHALPKYAFYSVLRILIAYILSLAFTLVYGYIAAYNARAERFMVPLLDVLQSIPVLSFLPGVMLAMVALFPRRQLGVELGAILLIFTGQVWNMAFSFYASLKSIPVELREAAQLYRFSWWQSFTQIELPYAAIGLIWNSMMSVAGGWFFLMVCEMFVLRDRDFRLPGLGSYLQTAAGAADGRAILWGVLTMVGVVVLTDQLVWRPLIAWAQKFKFENVEAADVPRSPVFDLLRRSRVISFVWSKTVRPANEALTAHFSQPDQSTHVAARPPKPEIQKFVLIFAGAGLAAAVVYGVSKAVLMISGLGYDDSKSLIIGAGATLLRVDAALILGALWTIPVGVAVGTNPKLARIAQPLAQIAASVPATALFPLVLLAIIRMGGGLGTGSILLLLLGTQWYILFNVIAGATAIPADLQEVCGIFHFSKVERWRKLILPAIFPYLITGMVTASGGAWNASIVAEYFHLQGRVFSTTGLGASISRATDNGDFRLLLAATILMAMIVVTVNRLLWRPLYRLAYTRFRLE